MILSIAFLDPGKPLPGTGWRPWVYLREVVQLVLVALSLVLGARPRGGRTTSTTMPIVEVAVLFLGIFICMQPALEILHVEGPSLPLSEPGPLLLGLRQPLLGPRQRPDLRGLLRDCPHAARRLWASDWWPACPRACWSAVSLGSVFMGAMTYIGNGPNFMVKAIAERSGVAMPSFFGYMVYSCAVLLPLLAVTACLSCAEVEHT